MAKRPGSLVLTFSRKNTDIRKLLENEKINNEAFVATDYICESIRFYEKYKNSTEFNDLSAIRNLIDERLKEFMKTNSSVTFGLAESQEAVQEKLTVNEIKTNINTLETNLDDVPIEED